MMTRDPVFLIGAERSGTTLLRLMLDHHPKIAFLPEFEFVVEQLDDQSALPDLDEYVNWLTTQRFLEEPGLEIRRTDSYATLVDDFLQQKRERDGKVIVGATVHRHFDRLLQIWPDARFIHLVRDPRDVARSSIQMGWAGNTYVALDRWLHAEGLWDSLETELPRDRWINLQFEKLIGDAQQELTRICDFIGVLFDPAMFDYANSSTYDLPDPASVQQWRSKSSNRDVRLAEARVGSWLESRGYELSGLPPMQISALQRVWLQSQSKWATRINRCRTLGLPLALADVFSRRLPGQPFRRTVHARVYEVARLHWK